MLTSPNLVPLALFIGYKSYTAHLYVHFLGRNYANLEEDSWKKNIIFPHEKLTELLTFIPISFIVGQDQPIEHEIIQRYFQDVRNRPWQIEENLLKIQPSSLGGRRCSAVR
jgi:hypothetical protein